MERVKASKTKDQQKHHDLIATINYEFIRQCPHADILLHKLADDLLTRYSHKNHPHPDFFKEDASLALQQLTLYADQYCQTLRQFDFLSTPADILSSLTSSCLRINDFLGNKLYQYMRVSQPVASRSPQQVLCASCGKQRENERIRGLKDELGVGVPHWNTIKLKRGAMSKSGQKYDEEQLLVGQMQNLDTLNEEQMRKNFRTLELYHDKRNQDMLICLQDLQRANQRVSSYGKAVDGKHKDYQNDNFNVKDYVFQLGRHFYHNLNNLDHKIRQLKQHLSPITDSPAQTDIPCLPLEDHRKLLLQLEKQLNTTEQCLQENTSQLRLKQRKCKQLEETNCFLQQKLNKSEKLRQQLQLERVSSQSHLKGTLAQYQNQMDSYKNIIRQLKSLPIDYRASFSDELNYKEVGVQSGERQQFPLSETPQIENKPCFRLIKSMRAFRSILMQPRLLQEFYRQQGEDGNSSFRPSVKSILSYIDQCQQSPLKIQHVLTQTIISPITLTNPPNDHPHSKRLLEDHKNNIDFRHLGIEQIHPKNNLGKASHHKKILTKLTATTNHRHSLLHLDHKSTRPKQLDSNLGVRNTYYPEFKNKMLTVYNSQNNSKEHYENVSDEGEEELNPLASMKNPRKTTKHLKKKRHYSQENSIQQYGNVSSLDKEVSQKQLFRHLEVILNSRPNQQCKKQSQRKLHLRHLKGEGNKAVLTLQQISYSTYLYSLLAKMRLKNPACYFSLKRSLCSLSGSSGDEEQGLKDSLKVLLVNHRRCHINFSSLCPHLGTLLQRVKQVSFQ